MEITLTISQACNMLNLGKTKLYELINAGKIPAKKINRKTLVLRSDLDAFLSNLEEYKTNKGGK